MADSMRALVWHGADDVRVSEVARPVPTDGQAIVDVAYAGVCGTDLHICAGEHPRAEAPLVLGHEIVGTLAHATDGLAAGQPVVVEPLLPCGDCTPCRRGQTHMCRNLRLLGIDAPGGAAAQVSVPTGALVALPEDLPLEDAAFTEPLAVAVHVIRRAEVALGDRVLVAGAGPIGQAVAVCAGLAGAAEVYVAEPVASRRAVAAQLGATLLDPDDPTADLAERTGGNGADIVFDAAAHPAVAAAMTGWTATGGRLVLVGTYGVPTALDLQDVLFRELEIRGCRVYTRRDFEHAIALLAARDFIPGPIVSSVVALEDGPAALDGLRAGTELKVLIDGNAL